MLSPTMEKQRLFYQVAELRWVLSSVITTGLVGKVTVTLADERWVGNDHQDSNEKLVRENFDQSSPARNFALKN